MLAGTDRVDAKVLVRSWRLEGSESTAPLDQALADLQHLVLMRQRVEALDWVLLAATRADADLRRRAALDLRRRFATASSLVAVTPGLGGLGRCVVYMPAVATMRCKAPPAAFYNRLH